FSWCSLFIILLLLSGCGANTAASTPAGLNVPRTTSNPPNSTPFARVTPTATRALPTLVPTQPLSPPTQTPSPTLSPAPTPAADTSRAKPLPRPTVTPTVSATLESLWGKIVFVSDRGSAYPQLYVMEADGSHPQLCACTELLEALVKRETTSPDQKQFL